jgi:hypothetical protein
LRHNSCRFSLRFCRKRRLFGVFHGFMSNDGCAAANKFSTILLTGRFELVSAEGLEPSTY